MDILEIENITKKFENDTVLKGISMKISEGEFLTILGPSGCGKTTTLRIISGIETADSGNIYLSGENITKKEPNKRDVNTVFQNYALFPHMNVFDNIAYSLKIKKYNKSDIKKEVNKMLELVKLEGYAKRKTNSLSGGEKQRVAIARALVNKPKVLLLDEPLGALDLKLRKYMQVEIKKLQKQLGITFINVTHDQEEALNMSDRIVVMNNGKIEQIASPREIYEKPATEFVSSFVGERNSFKSKIYKQNNLFYVEFSDKKIEIDSNNLSDNDNVYCSILCDKVNISYEKKSKNDIKGVISQKLYTGSQITLTVDINNYNREFKVILYNDKKEFNEGDTVYINWNKQNLVVI